MARFALVAALLLAAVPTLGRLAPQLSQAMQAAHEGLVALCTAQGLRYVGPDSPIAASTLVAAGHGAGHVPAHGSGHGHHDAHGGAAPGPLPHEHGEPDCAYCPLLLSLLVAGCWLLRLRPLGVRGSQPARFRAASRAFLHPCGLGSRGPPRMDRCLRA